MKNIQVTLSTGEVVKVYPVNPYVADAAVALVKPPPMAKRKINPEVALPGQENDMVDDPENPEYKAAYNAYLQAASEAYMNTRLMYGLRDVEAPAAWPTERDVELWEFVGVAIPDTSTPLKKKLAYIKYGLLGSQGDLETVLQVIDNLGSVDQEEVRQLVASFRHKGERDTPASVPAQKV